MKKILYLIIVCHPIVIFAQEKGFAESFIENFSSPKMEHFRNGSMGTKSSFKCNSGIASLFKKDTRILSLKLDTLDAKGAGKGPEIISNDFTHFGIYSTRLKVPDARILQSNVGAVVGYFTYHNDKILGLSEIDFEWLLADPNIIYIGTWTGESGKLQRIGRTINLKTGEILNTSLRINHDGQNTPLLGEQNFPVKLASMPNYDASARFYTYGFDWESDSIRWWIINPQSGDKIILWHYQGSYLGIPQHASKYRMNFWHTDNWPVETNENSIEKPKHNFELEVDWMSYESLK
jgi:hypothetical protein